MLPPIKTYSVKVDGFSPVLYSARTPSKARTAAWRAYCAAYDCSFGHFLRIARVRKVDDPPEVGKRVMIEGAPATTVLCNGFGIGFMRDDNDVIFTAHETDVQPIHG